MQEVHKECIFIAKDQCGLRPYPIPGRDIQNDAKGLHLKRDLCGANFDPQVRLSYVATADEAAVGV